MAQTKRVLIVGGGPAGMQAAVTAAERGHSVVLIERSAQLGGQARIAARGPGRGEILNAILFLERELMRGGVEVRLNRTANADALLRENADMLIIATGSDAAIPSLAQADTARMFSVREILSGDINLQGNVVVLDGLGRLAAANAAEYLARRGCRVTITARSYAIGANIDSTTRPVMERSLRESNVTMLPGKAIESFQNGKVLLRDTFTGGQMLLSEISALVYDLGGRADDSLYHALVSRGANVARIGDCVAPRGMQDAWREGYEMGMKL